MLLQLQLYNICCTYSIESSHAFFCVDLSEESQTALALAV